MNNSFKQKYFKYKQKYLNLKHKLGGSKINSILDEVFYNASKHDIDIANIADDFFDKIIKKDNKKIKFLFFYLN